MFDLYSFLTEPEFGDGPASAAALLMCQQSEPPTYPKDAKPQHKLLRESFWNRPREGQPKSDKSLKKLDMPSGPVFVRDPVIFGPNTLGNPGQQDQDIDQPSNLSNSVAEAICKKLEPIDKSKNAERDIHNARVKAVATAVDELLRNVIWHSQPIDLKDEARGWIGAVRSNWLMSLVIRDKGHGILASFEEQAKKSRTAPSTFEEDKAAIEKALLRNVSSKDGDLFPTNGTGLSIVRDLSLTLCIASGAAAVFTRKGRSDFEKTAPKPGPGNKSGYTVPKYVRDTMEKRETMEFLDLTQPGRHRVTGTVVELLIDLESVASFMAKLEGQRE